MNPLIPFDIAASLHQLHESVNSIKMGGSDDASGVQNVRVWRLFFICLRSVHPEHFAFLMILVKKLIKRQSIHAKNVCVCVVVEAGHSSLLIFRSSHASTQKLQQYMGPTGGGGGKLQAPDPNTTLAF